MGGTIIKEGAMKNYIKESHQRMQNRKEYMLYNVPVHIIHKFPPEIDLQDVLSRVEDKLSFNFFQGLDAVYVGEFKDLKKRKIQAMFKDGAIWLSSKLEGFYNSEEIIVQNIIHEVAHLLEEQYNLFLYGDNALDTEYNSKKYKLFNIMKAEGYKIPSRLFFQDDHLKEFDNFLYKEVGYDKLALLSLGLFITPYSVTTLREYFANGVQMFFSEERDYLKEVSPVLYNKIKYLLNEVENEN
tara:strand:- start:8574 stop:9296 length:723 start_codon:yes stop_codon:yes gene_type:complete